MAEMQGIQHRVEGNKLIVEVDLTQDFGDSSTGKTRVIGSSGGFQKLPLPGVSFSMNVCKSKKV